MHRFQSAALGTLTALLAACSFLPQELSPADTHAVYAWPLDRCPSVPPAQQVERSALIGSIAAILAGDVISGLVGVPALALANAAEADKKGFTAAGTNARFYYRASKNATTGQLQVMAPGCYVVAYAKPGGQGSWCDNNSFAVGAAAACANGSSLIASLLGKDRLKDQTEKVTQPLMPPEFYMEIGFDRSGYEPIVRPKVVALYYPKSLLDPSSSKKRTMSISLAFTSPANSDALKAASIAITLAGATPGDRIPDEVLVNAQTAWSSLPVLKPNDGIKDEGAYIPITIAATIHEVGEPSLFLAAFSKALTASTGDISKAIGNTVLPAGQAAAEQQAQTNLASYDAAYAIALKSNVEYVTACAKNPSNATEKEAAAALYHTVRSNRQKANIAASAAGVPPPFASITPDRQCF